MIPVWNTPSVSSGWSVLNMLGLEISAQIGIKAMISQASTRSTRQIYISFFSWRFHRGIQQGRNRLDSKTLWTIARVWRETLELPAEDYLIWISNFVSFILN